MSPRTKQILIVLVIAAGVGALACLVCGVGGYFRAQEWLTDMTGDARQTIEEASAFAATHDQAACREETLRRVDACEVATLSCFTQGSIFLNRCFRAATPTPGICDGVPAQGDIFGSASWAQHECNDRGHRDDPRCNQVQQLFQQVCHQPPDRR